MPFSLKGSEAGLTECKTRALRDLKAGSRGGSSGSAAPADAVHPGLLLADIEPSVSLMQEDNVYHLDPLCSLPVALP